MECGLLTIIIIITIIIIALQYTHIYKTEYS